MIKRIIILFISLFIISNLLISQTNTTPAESRKENLKKLLDYRYKGGFYSFESLFWKTVEYPEIAKKNCIVGIAIVRFEVDCEGSLKNLRVTNSLQWGIEGEIQKFMNATLGNWNKCDDEKYTKFEVPIQFIINETEMNTDDAMIVLKTEMIGYQCKGDSYYKEKLDKALKKGRKNKSLKYVKELIKRDPYNNEYYEIRKKILEEKK